MLVRFDPFKEIDRAFSAGRTPTLAMDAFRQGERDKDTAVRPCRHCIGHMRRESPEAGIEAGRIKLLQALDLRRQEAAAAPFVCNPLRHVARRDVRVLRLPLRVDGDAQQGRFADHEAGANTWCNELRKRADVQRTLGGQAVQRRFVLTAITKEPVRRVFNDQKSVLRRELGDSTALGRGTRRSGRILEVGDDVETFRNLSRERPLQHLDVRTIGLQRNAHDVGVVPA